MIAILKQFASYSASIIKDDSKPIASVKAFDKNIPVYKRGFGNIPLLITGPANLFKKPELLPLSFNNVFTIYFVDLFEKPQNYPVNYSQLTLNDFVDQFENIREQLGLKKIALFGHSANGVLALEYASKYPDKVLLNIIVGTAPIWGDYKNELVKGYFNYNSHQTRQQLFKLDQEQLTKQKSGLPTGTSFVANYNARRAYFYYKPQLANWKTLWDGLHLDEDLVNHYFSLIKSYDVRKRFYSPRIPTFLGLGLYDYSCPFYAWTDDSKAQLADMEYYIFESSGHYPQVEEAALFANKLFEYIERNKIMVSNTDEKFRSDMRP